MATLTERVAELTARLPDAGQPVAVSTVITVFIEVARQPLPSEDDTGLLMLDLGRNGEQLVLSLGHDFHGFDSADALHALTVEGTVEGFDVPGLGRKLAAVYRDEGESIDQWEERLREHPVVANLMRSRAVLLGWHMSANTDD